MKYRKKVALLVCVLVLTLTGLVWTNTEVEKRRHVATSTGSEPSFGVTVSEWNGYVNAHRECSEPVTLMWVQDGEKHKKDLRSETRIRVGLADKYEVFREGQFVGTLRWQKPRDLWK